MEGTYHPAGPNEHLDSRSDQGYCTSASFLCLDTGQEAPEKDRSEGILPVLVALLGILLQFYFVPDRDHTDIPDKGLPSVEAAQDIEREV